jgi:hypothetical protein
MDVAVRTQAMGKSLPAELVVGGKSGYRRLMQNSEVLQQRGLRGLGMDADEWAKLIAQTTAATVPLIVSQNPGTYYTTDPRTGQITVYAQPTGSTQNLPVGFPVPGAGYGAGAGGSVQTPVGSATFGGIDTGTIALVALVGLGFFMLMGQRR